MSMFISNAKPDSQSNTVETMAAGKGMREELRVPSFARSPLPATSNKYQQLSRDTSVDSCAGSHVRVPLNIRRHQTPCLAAKLSSCRAPPGAVRRPSAKKTSETRTTATHAQPYAIWWNAPAGEMGSPMACLRAVCLLGVRACNVCMCGDVKAVRARVCVCV